MPKTAPLTREEIEAQAAELAAQVAAFQAEDQRRAEEQQRRRDAALRQFDEQFVDSVSVSVLTAEVDEARAALGAALADTPLVQGIAAYITALHRRSHLYLERSSALDRLGRPTAPKPAGWATEVPSAEIPELIAQAAARIATTQVAAELAELHGRRDAAGTETTQKENR